MNQSDAKKVAGKVNELIRNTIPASPDAGEMAVTHSLTIPNVAFDAIETGPFQYLLGGIGRLFGNLAGIMRDKKRLIGVLIIAALWFVLLLLASLGGGGTAVNWLRFLTFADGGGNGNALGQIGGLIGKGFYSYFIFVLLIPLFTGKNPLSGILKGLRTGFGAIAHKEKGAYAPLIMGTGGAFISYNFMAGSASPVNSMIGIAACLLSLQAISSQQSFLRGLILSFLKQSKLSMKRQRLSATHVMTGWAFGFVLAVPLSALGISGIGYVSGILLILVSVILKLTAGREKGAKQND